MSDKPYSNRELDMKLENLSRLMREIGDTLTQGISRLETSLGDSHNRVSILEVSEENRRGANRILTYIAIPAVGFLITYLTWIGVQIMDIKTTIQTVTPVEKAAIQSAVSEAIRPYAKP